MPRPESAGSTLPELLLVVVITGLLAALGLVQTRQSLARLRVESATRRVTQGLEWGRAAAQQLGRPCALQLSSDGWTAPSGGTVPACPGGTVSLGEGTDRNPVQLEHNLPAAVRFTSNGLVLDGGTVLLSSPGTDLVRCVVISLPLGVMRLGQWQQGACRPDPAL